MSSSRTTYPDFKRRLDRLANSLLPPDNPAGVYSDGEKDRIHAYLVLAHAEIEDFLEKLASYVTDRERRNSSTKKCSPVISRLILYKSARGNEKIEAVTADSIAGAVKFYESIIEGNNGIKAKDIFRMFMPLGLTHDDFDPVMMQDLDSFGILRGGLAHTSARLQQGASPSSERRRVENIAVQLSHFDQRVRALQ
jgi:hypothetical protein